MQFYNAHTHIFTMNNCPKDFLELYMPPIAAKAVDSITDTKVGSWMVKSLLNAIGGEAKRYATFLKIGKSKTQNEVLRHMLASYSDTSIKVIALTLNMEYLGVGRSTSGYAGQLEEIINLKRRYPDTLYPFLSVDPRWMATGEQIRDAVVRYFDKKVQVNGSRSVYPFAGIKLYPSTGFYVFDPKLKPTMEWAAANGVPIMTHCSYLGGIYHNDTNYLKGNISNCIDPYTGARYDKPVYHGYTKKDRTNNHETCSYYLEPYSYRSMIEYFVNKGTPLKICFAHYGGNKHMLMEHTNTNKGPFIGVDKGRNWAMQIRDLMQYPGIYADISYSLSDKKTYPFIFSEMKNAKYADRILFGTDFFMTEREAEEKSTYNDFRTQALDRTNAAFDGTLAWEKMAMQNVQNYLAGKYANG
jgi:predicted TIM-barrel fold metal-dependent hydrolase